jgi:hypothetical protein
VIDPLASTFVFTLRALPSLCSLASSAVRDRAVSSPAATYRTRDGTLSRSRSAKPFIEQNADSDVWWAT